MKEAVYISSSIANFREKLLRRFELPEWHWLLTSRSPAIFFGLYHPVDYCRFLWHLGDRTVFWCGADILNLRTRPFWQGLIRASAAKHICENQVEQAALQAMGIESIIRPCLFDTIENIEVSFQPARAPQVYLCAHPGREAEYGVNMIERLHARCPQVTFHIYGLDHFSHDNVIYHGQVTPAQFDAEIKNYQAALRLNEFDGCSEIMVKSVLMGQYPISRIVYPQIDHFATDEELVQLLLALGERTAPNPTSAWWREHLQRSLAEIRS